MVNLYAVYFQENTFIKDFSSYIHLLSEEKVEKMKNYRMQIDQVRCILGEILLKYILWKHHGIEQQKILYKYNKNGKPLLANQEGVYFNISHSGSWILCGVSNCQIGVDVEGGNREEMQIAKRFFTKEEYTYLECLDSCTQKGVFYKLWTLKESYVKCIGKGLQIPFNSFRFGFLNEAIQMYQCSIKNNEYSFLSQQIQGEYYVALCIKKEDYSFSDTNILNISLEELLGWIKII
jgi:4'-phosphopantetheinyl transferase